MDLSRCFVNWAGCGFGSTGIFGCDSHYRLIARETITLVSGAGFWRGGGGVLGFSLREIHCFELISTSRET